MTYVLAVLASETLDVHVILSVSVLVEAYHFFIFK